MKTRSVRYGRGNDVELIEVDVADPGPDEVQVQALACGVCAWDVHVYAHGFEWDVMPGHEGVARVVKVGANVRGRGFEEGARVTGHGLGFTEFANVKPEQLHRLPVNGHADEHWIVEPVSCVVTGLDHCQLRAGERVVVVGCGFMGLLMVQGLGRSMLDQVVAIDLDADRLALARRFNPSPPKPMTPARMESNFLSVHGWRTRNQEVISSSSSTTHVLPVTIVVCLAGLLAGCTPASVGLLWPSQKNWHQEASMLIDKIEANGHLDRQEVEERFGKPDAVVPGDAFITGHEELDKYRAYKLHLRGWTDGGDPSRLHDEQWMTSTILIYDENARYPWPIAGDWRAYLFQLRDGKIAAGWDTYPGWTPWRDDYWDDVRERMEDGGE